VLLPVVCCGYETVWDVRCTACGGYAWFDAEADGRFRQALTEARSEGGDLETQRAETDRRYSGTLSPCSCGGAWRVVRDWDREPCLGCGRPLAGAPMEPQGPLDVPPASRPDASNRP